MRTFLSKSIGRMTVGIVLLCAPAPIVFSGCTDLTEVPKDALTPANAFGNEAEVLAGVASVYATLRSTMGDRYNLSEVTTDEIIVPTRGQDWYDNGAWLETYKHTWTPNSGGAAGVCLRPSGGGDAKNDQDQSEPEPRATNLLVH